MIPILFDFSLLGFGFGVGLSIWFASWGLSNVWRTFRNLLTP